MKEKENERHESKERVLWDRQSTLTRLPDRDCERAYSACRDLFDLVGTPRVPDAKLALWVYEGPKRSRKRLDVDAQSLNSISCGKDHILFIQQGPGGTKRFYGVGNNSKNQVRNQWRRKPPHYSAEFSKPVECDFHQSRIDPVKARQVKEARIKRLKRERKLARIQRRREQQERNEALSEDSDSDVDIDDESDYEDDIESFPEVSSISAGCDNSAVVFSGVNKVWWSGRQGAWLHVERKVTHVSAGTHHVLIHCSDRKVYGFGLNTAGQLGVGPFALPSRPEEALQTKSQGEEKVDTDLDAEETEDMFQPTFIAYPVLIASKASTVVAAFERSYLIDGAKVWNPTGSFLHFFDEPVESLKAGRDHFVVLLKKSRKILAMGSNERGAVGVTSTLRPRGGYFETPQVVNNQLGPLWTKCERVEEIAAGEHFSALRTNQGDVFVWGSINGNDLLLRPQKIDTLQRPAAGISAGPKYLVIITK